MTVDERAGESLAVMVEELAVQTRGPLAYVRSEDGKVSRETATDLPLLTQLHRAAQGLEGSGRGGKADAERMLVRARALDEWRSIRDEIQGVYEMAVGALPDGLRGHPIPVLTGWWTVVQASIDRGDATQMQVERVRSYLTDWRRRVLEVVAPPWRKEIMIHCPLCGKYRVVTDGGDEVQAVVAEGSRVDGVRLFCRACRVVVASGRAEVTRVARGAGLDVDADLVRDAMFDKIGE